MPHRRSAASTAVFIKGGDTFNFNVEDVARSGLKNPLSQGNHIVDGEAVRVSAATDELFCFYEYRYPILIIGEVPILPGNIDLQRLYERLVLKNGIRSANERVASPAISIVDTGRNRLFSNLSCSRPVYNHHGESAFRCSGHLYPKPGFAFPSRFWASPGTIFQPIVDVAGELPDRAILRSLQVDRGPGARVLWGLINIYLWHKMHDQGVAAVDVKEKVSSRRRNLEKAAA